MSIYAGIFNSASLDAIPTFQKKSFMGSLITTRPTGTAPLFAMMAAMKEATAINRKHSYFTREWLFPKVTTHGVDIAAITTAITVVDNTQLIPGMILLVDSTGEEILVLTIVAGGTTGITAVRGFGRTAAAVIPASTTMYEIGNAYEESSTRPQALNIIPTEIENYTQIFRNSFAISGTAAQIGNILGEGNVSSNKADAAALHAEAIERAMIFGSLKSSALNGMPIRKMDGIISQVAVNAAANITTAGATTTYAQLETALEKMFDIGIDGQANYDRVLFVGATARKVINGIGRIAYGANYMTDVKTNAFGLRFMDFVTARGTFHMVEHPMLNANPVWAKMALCVNLDAIKPAYLTGRKTVVGYFNQKGEEMSDDNGIDATGGSFLTELTLENVAPMTCGVVKNLTAAA